MLLGQLTFCSYKKGCGALAKRNEIDFLNVNRTHTITLCESDCGQIAVKHLKKETNQNFNLLLLCILWDRRGIIYFKFLLSEQTLNSNFYCQEPDHLKTAIDQRWAGLILCSNKTTHYYSNSPETGGCNGSIIESELGTKRVIFFSSNATDKNFVRERL